MPSCSSGSAACPASSSAFRSSGRSPAGTPSWPGSSTSRRRRRTFVQQDRRHRPPEQVMIAGPSCDGIPIPGGPPVLEGFKKFILKGNVVDLAVGIVIGAAFAGVITQFTASFITPLVAAVAGGGIDGGTFDINGVTFDVGAFIGAVFSFLVTAAVIYFVV